MPTDKMPSVLKNIHRLTNSPGLSHFTHRLDLAVNLLRFERMATASRSDEWDEWDEWDHALGLYSKKANPNVDFV